MSPNDADPNDYIGPGILYITLKSDKQLNYAKVKLLTAERSPVCGEKKTLDSREVTFSIPKEQPLSPGMVLQVKYSHPRTMKKTIDIMGDDLRSAYTPGGPNKQAWKRTYEDVELLMDLENPCRPTTERILEACPRFRILVMGKSGVGKSSLINQVFGHVDIDCEFTSEKNRQLVLHDSRGFEPGENDNFQIVQDFIKRRGEKREIEKKLHAIWLCIKAPISGGRTLETGVEQFLQLKRDGKLGDVPIVVVFPNYDQVVLAKRREDRRVFYTLREGRGEGYAVDTVIDLIKEFTISDQDAFAEQNNTKVDKLWENMEDELWDTQARRKVGL